MFQQRQKKGKKFKRAQKAQVKTQVIPELIIEDAELLSKEVIKNKL